MLILDQLKHRDHHLQWVAAVILLGMTVLAGGLWYVQVAASKRYQTNLENQMFRTVRLPAVRGKILDRHGVPLAENRPRYNISLYLEELRKPFQIAYTEQSRAAKQSLGRTKLTRDELSTLARRSRYLVASNLVQQVSSILQQPLVLSEAQFHKHYDQRLALPLPIAENLGPAEVARFMETFSALPGVDLEIQAIRVYPQGRVAAHVLGFMRRDDSSLDDEEAYYNYRLPDFRGEAGVESVYDTELRGKAGGKSMLVNNLGYRQNESVWNPPVAGNNLVLTLDARIQQAAEAAMRSASANTRGAAVVMDCRNGDILASVSVPSFDPNAFLPSLSHSEWEQLNDPHFRPMINRAMYGAYPPGSIFKIVVGLAALEAGLNPHAIYKIEPNPGDRAKGVIYVGRRPWKDTAPPGDYDFRRALKLSSNSYFIQHGLKTGPANIVELGEQFHFGERMNLLPRQEVAGHFPTAKDIELHWFDGDTANISIGQGPIALTPLQVAVMTSAIANGGKVFWPRLVSHMESQDRDTKERLDEVAAGRVRHELKVQPAHLAVIRDAMLADVEDSDGTGRNSAVSGFRVCGKTGTAQITQGVRVVDHVTWFVSFAPYENPRYTVVVMVESGASGGGTCAPIARQIYQAIQKIGTQTASLKSGVAVSF
jgi:penicillin-binding protein 2